MGMMDMELQGGQRIGIRVAIVKASGLSIQSAANRSVANAFT